MTCVRASRRIFIVILYGTCADENFNGHQEATKVTWYIYIWCVTKVELYINRIYQLYNYTGIVQPAFRFTWYRYWKPGNSTCNQVALIVVGAVQNSLEGRPGGRHQPQPYHMADVTTRGAPSALSTARPVAITTRRVFAPGRRSVATTTRRVLAPWTVDLPASCNHHPSGACT